MSKETHTRYVINLSDLRTEDYVIVGEAAYNDYYFLKSGINTPQGFVLTKLAFDDFLLDNESISLFSRLLEKKELAHDHIVEISDMIRNAIESGTINEEIKTQIKQTFDISFGKNKNLLLAISPSFLFTKHAESTELYKPLVFSPTDIDEVFEYIKKVYISFYTPELVEARLRGDFQISCFAVLIRQIKSFEISGRAIILKSRFNKNESLEIEAQYGNLSLNSRAMPDTAVDAQNQFSDVYSIDTETFKILHRKLIDQQYMFVRKRKENEKIEVAHEWKGKQKLPDHRIYEVVDVVIKLDQIYKRPLEIYWGYEKGILYVVSTDYLNLQEEELNILNAQQGNNLNAIKDLSEIQSTLGSNVNNYTKIETTIGLNNASNMFLNRGSLLVRLRGGFNINTSLLQSTANVFFEQEEFNYTDSNILRNTNANAYLNGNTLINKYSNLAKDLNEDTQKEIINKFTIELASLTYQFYPKNVIYQISDVNIPAQDDTYLKRVLTEAVAVRTVKEDYDYSNLGICLTSISTLDSLNYILAMLEKLRLKNGKDFKVFSEISSASLLYDLDSLAEEDASINLDGFIISIDKLMVSLFNKTTFYSDDRNLFQRIFQNKMNKLKSKNFKFIFRLVNNSPDIIDNITRLDPFGLVLPFAKSESI